MSFMVFFDLFLMLFELPLEFGQGGIDGMIHIRASFVGGKEVVIFRKGNLGRVARPFDVENDVGLDRLDKILL